MATVLRYTGLRVGTVMLLEWRDFDLDAAKLIIRTEVDKEKKGRTVPLSKHLVAELAGWGVRSGYLIPSGRNEGDRERQVRARDFSRAWARAGVRSEAWSGQPTHAFRKGIKTGLLALGAVPDAVDYIQGHELGSGSRSRYIDPWQALHLRETVDLVPKIGAVTPVVRFNATSSGSR